MESWLQTHPKHVLVLHCRVNVTDSSEHTDTDMLFKLIYVPSVSMWSLFILILWFVLHREGKAGSEFWWLLTSTSATCHPGNTYAMWVCWNDRGVKEVKKNLTSALLSFANQREFGDNHQQSTVKEALESTAMSVDQWGFLGHSDNANMLMFSMYMFTILTITVLYVGMLTFAN